MPRGRPKHDDILTPREWEVLDLLCRGLSNQQIGERLHISESGARYHVSEIISKLGVANRYEAANWRTPATRPSRFAGIAMLRLSPRLFSTSLFAVAGIALLLIAAGVLVMRDRRDVQELASLPSVALPEESAGAVASPPPTPEEIARSGHEVTFKVCSQTTNWHRPRDEQMSAVFADRRFGDGVKPSPENYFLYLSDFFYIPVRDSMSINKQTTAFSGTFEEQPGAVMVTECDPASMIRDYQAASSSQYATFTVLDHRVVSMHQQNDDLLLVVEEAPESWQSVYFPYPPESHPATADLEFDSIQIATKEGRLLQRYRFVRGANPANWQVALYDEAGSVFAALFHTGPSTDLAHIAVKHEAFYLLYGGPTDVSAFPPRRLEGAVHIQTIHGRDWGDPGLRSQPTAWFGASRFPLAPDVYHFDLDMRGIAEAYTYLLLREDIPLP